MARSTYLHPGSPGMVIRPGDALDVIAALAFARGQDVPLSVRSGGHGISGRSTNDGGIVIDLGRLHEVEVLDRATSRIRVGPGARWGNVAQALAPYRLGMSSGNFGDVGAGGLATTAGVGLLVRKHGLTIDHVLAAEVILADGTFVRADAGQHPDLFWALRGAGGNFGIVTAFELGAYAVGEVVFSLSHFPATPDLLVRWGQVLEEAPRELTSFLGIFRRAAQQELPHPALDRRQPTADADSRLENSRVKAQPGSHAARLCLGDRYQTPAHKNMSGNVGGC
jgi:FAD/FMN-containing dehydrogenase